ncbi:group II intron reverse transcriptase/maturase [Blautia coccoides]|uniref:group II intron reverse transcriptase/maturase n=1 Tax=Blautia producta TaxID=33035 RepID=UPI002149ECC6|nr:group II intron reverse transcriptase/maturase [Blautia coccoides]MCR1984872.1 group II intron reverse transcriptase/maturase [Blautia coccoides]
MQTNSSKEKVRQLQNKLYLIAKKCSSRRFHALYDKVYRDDVLVEAWKRVKANKGSSGVDGIRIEDIEAQGVNRYLTSIQSELKDGKYKPSPVRRVMIPKPDGSERPLGIPTVKDRIVQMAAKIAIEPVFEADFKECAYGFRPKKSAKQALEKVRKACNNKGYYVVDADIEKFFDNVNQDKLMKLVEQRVSDRRILKLIRQWLKSGVLYGNVLEVSELGTSQGSVISPLLANIYLNTLDRLWEKYGLTHGILVRYADDSVIICKNKKSANHALNLMQYIMEKLDLKLHPVKTKIVCMWDGKEGFDFLGMHHRRMARETRKGQIFKETYQYPSKKAMKKMKTAIKSNINSRKLLVAKEEDLIKNLNPKITGWRNYYQTKTSNKWLQSIDWYIICTFTRWYNKKHQRRKQLSKVGFVRTSIYEKGLKRMAAT